MPIALSCPCGREYRLRDDLAGKQIRCKECSAVVSVPTDEDLDAAAGIEQAEMVAQPKFPVAIGYRPSENSQSSRLSSDDDNRPRPLRKRKRWRPRYDPDEERRYRGGGIHISPGVIYGAAMMITAVIWLIAGLFLGWIFFYPPVLFIVGLVRLIMALMGHED